MIMMFTTLARKATRKWLSEKKTKPEKLFISKLGFSKQVLVSYKIVSVQRNTRGSNVAFSRQSERDNNLISYSRRSLDINVPSLGTFKVTFIMTFSF